MKSWKREEVRAVSFAERVVVLSRRDDETEPRQREATVDDLRAAADANGFLLVPKLAAAKCCAACRVLIGGSEESVEP